MDHTVSTFFTLNAIHILQLAFSAMTAILFLQSGLDKLFNWKGEKEWLTGHFAKSFLKGTVPLLLPVIASIELAAGCCSAIGFFCALLGCGSGVGFLGMIFGLSALVMLFFGQRVAKDYQGAASLIPYFLLCAAGLYFYSA